MQKAILFNQFKTLLIVKVEINGILIHIYIINC